MRSEKGSSEISKWAKEGELGSGEKTVLLDAYCVLATLLSERWLDFFLLFCFPLACAVLGMGGCVSVDVFVFVYF